MQSKDPYQLLTPEWGLWWVMGKQVQVPHRACRAFRNDIAFAFSFGFLVGFFWPCAKKKIKPRETKRLGNHTSVVKFF
jgi:hypothetical protein